MKNSLQTGELSFLVCGLCAWQLICANAGYVFDVAGYASYICVIVGGVGVALLARFFPKMPPNTDVFENIAHLGVFGRAIMVAIGLVFVLLCAISVADLLFLLSNFVLLQTPRVVLLISVGLVIVMFATLGVTSIARTFKLMSRTFIVIFAITIFVSTFTQIDVYAITPVLGNGLAALGQGTLNALFGFVWVLVALLEQGNCPKLKLGRVVLVATLFAGISYIACGMIEADSRVLSSYPVIRLSSMGGNSELYQRALIIFACVWIPLTVIASSTGLCYSCRYFASAFKVKNARWFVVPIFALVAFLCFPLKEERSAWLQVVFDYKLIAFAVLGVIVFLFCLNLWLKCKCKGEVDKSE